MLSKELWRAINTVLTLLLQYNRGFAITRLENYFSRSAEIDIHILQAPRSTLGLHCVISCTFSTQVCFCKGKVCYVAVTVLHCLTTDVELFV